MGRSVGRVNEQVFSRIKHIEAQDSDSVDLDVSPYGLSGTYEENLLAKRYFLTATTKKVLDLLGAALIPQTSLCHTRNF